MWIDELLRKMAARERRLIDVEAAEGPGSACWPAWRVLLWKTCDPERLAAWWEAHGQSCAVCRETARRVEADALSGAPVDAPGPVQSIL